MLGYNLACEERYGATSAMFWSMGSRRGEHDALQNICGSCVSLLLERGGNIM